MAGTRTTQRTPLSPVNESPSPEIDFLQPTSCQTACDQRRSQLQADEDAVNEERGEIIKSQKEAVRVALCKMKTEWKKMTVKDFNEAFSCDVIAMVMKQIDMEPGQKRVGMKNAAVGSLKTPAVKFAGMPPVTRTVRKGERVV
jgi:hypothetical protein